MGAWRQWQTRRKREPCLTKPTIPLELRPALSWKAISLTTPSSPAFRIVPHFPLVAFSVRHRATQAKSHCSRHDLSLTLQVHRKPTPVHCVRRTRDTGEGFLSLLTNRAAGCAPDAGRL